MKLLQELVTLFETPAKVHVNGKLTVLIDLIQREFGSVLKDVPFKQRCLIGQFAYVIEARTGIAAVHVFDELNKYFIKADDHKRYQLNSRGATPQDLIDIYDKAKLRIDDKTVRLHVSFHVYESVEEIISAVQSGHPVIMAYNTNSSFARGVENGIEGSFNRGSWDYTTFNHDHSYFHSLLGIGYDSESEELVFRDIRSTYLYKGYVKIPKTEMVKHLPEGKAFTFDVDVEVLPKRGLK